MSAGLEPTTFGEFQRKPKTNALPLRQDTLSDLDDSFPVFYVYIWLFQCYSQHTYLLQRLTVIPPVKTPSRN